MSIIGSCRTWGGKLPNRPHWRGYHCPSPVKPTDFGHPLVKDAQIDLAGDLIHEGVGQLDDTDNIEVVSRLAKDAMLTSLRTKTQPVSLRHEKQTHTLLQILLYIQIRLHQWFNVVSFWSFRW